MAVFKNFFFSFRKFNYNVSWLELFWIYSIWILSAFEPVSFCVLANLESFQPEFFKILIQLYSLHLFFWDSNDKNVDSFVTIPLAPENLLILFRLFFFQILRLNKFYYFVLQFMNYILCHQWGPTGKFHSFSMICCSAIIISYMCFIWFLFNITSTYLLRFSIFYLFQENLNCQVKHFHDGSFKILVQ